LLQLDEVDSGHFHSNGALTTFRTIDPYQEALKGMKGGESPIIKIGVRKSGELPILTVSDNGTGIDPRYHKKIFALFHMLDPSTEGTGIGLAIVKRIIDVHGRQIWVESKGIGHGSTFCFTLPEGGADEVDEIGNIEGKGGRVMDHQQLQQLNVPPVEDNPAHKTLILRLFKRRGEEWNHIEHVGDGEAALDYLFRRNHYTSLEGRPLPHLILLDLRLPKVDGIEVLEVIKASDTLRHIPVVVLTSSDSEGDLKQAYGNYADSYLVKPLDYKEFSDLMDYISSYWLQYNRYNTTGGR